jgi:hypothetical protein
MNLLRIPPGLNLPRAHKRMAKYRLPSWGGFREGLNAALLRCDALFAQDDTDYIVINGVKFGFDYTGGGLGEPARCAIQCVAKANLVDNTDTFTLVDSEDTSETFYYDVDGLAGGTGTPIDVSGDTSANDVAKTTATVISAAAVKIVVPDPGAATIIEPCQEIDGTAGNQTNTENVNDAGFTVSNFTGGTDQTADYVIDLSGSPSSSTIAYAILSTIGGAKSAGDLPKCIRVTQYSEYLYIENAESVQLCVEGGPWYLETPVPQPLCALSRRFGFGVQLQKVGTENPPE